MASRLGARFGGLQRSILPNRPKGLWHGCPVLVDNRAKNMERRDCSVFPILANKLRIMGPPCAGAGSVMCLARLESWLALGQDTSSGHRIRVACRRDLRRGLFCPNRAVGLGQSQAHGLGVLSHSSVFVERSDWSLGVSGTGCYLRC